ncbi:MAG TPA: hypothetical protein VHO07_14870 [Streptosporangiaceae bacterium]|nr:hypothetical protein [Streptosporangiaceae bacterium]
MTDPGAQGVEGRSIFMIGMCGSSFRTRCWLCPGREPATGTWMSHGSAQDSVMMQVPNIGAFVRALRR